MPTPYILYLIQLKTKYAEKSKRYTIHNEEYDRVIKKLEEIEIELKAHIHEHINPNHIWNKEGTKYSKYCPNYDSDLDK